MNISLRKFFRLGALLATLVVFQSPVTHAAGEEVKLGVQTWTLRNLNFDQVVEFCVKHKIKYLEVIGNHMDPKAPIQETARKKAILEKNGLVVYSFGVAGTSSNKEEDRKLFEFAKYMGIKVIIIEPGDFKTLDHIEELVKEYDIKVAIHNHGIKSNYGNPGVVRNLLQHRDQRIGVCLDTGWITSARFDAATVYNEYKGRVYDIHLKDKKVHATENGDVATDTFVGEGSTNLKALFKVLKESGYPGVLAIETDNNLKDPTEHMTKAIQFVAENYPK